MLTCTGLFEPSHMQYEIDRSEDKAGEPTLAQLTEKAIKILDREPKGYFLFVEGKGKDKEIHTEYFVNAINICFRGVSFQNKMHNTSC